MSETETEPVLPETLEILLRGNLHRKSLRAGIAAELERAKAVPGTCDGCHWLSDRSEVPRCDLHGRGTEYKNFCSWYRPKE